MDVVELTVAGVRSAVHVGGPQDSTEAVVFVHGNPGGGTDWRDLQSRVSPFARTIAPDMPGFAGADKPRRFDYSPRGYGRHLGGLLRELGVERAHFVLHDFAGLWGCECILQNPEIAASATLLGMGPLPNEPKWHHWARVWRLPVVGELMQYGSPAVTARVVIGRENPRLSREQVASLAGRISPYATRRAVLAMYRATPSIAREFRVKDGSPERYVDGLAKLDLPALVLWPTEDRYVQFEPEYQREGFPSAQIEILEGLGHWLHWEEPDQIAGHVVPFLRAQLRTPSAVA